MLEQKLQCSKDRDHLIAMLFSENEDWVEIHERYEEKFHVHELHDTLHKRLSRARVKDRRLDYLITECRIRSPWKDTGEWDTNNKTRLTEGGRVRNKYRLLRDQFVVLIKVPLLIACERVMGPYYTSLSVKKEAEPKRSFMHELYDS